MKHIKERNANRTSQSRGEKFRILSRRFLHKLQDTLAVNRAIGPAAFLGISAVLGVAMTLATLYSTSYAVLVNGKQVGVVADQAVVSRAIQEVEADGSSLLGYPYEVTGEIDYLCS